MLEGIWAVANPAVFLLAYSNDCFSSQRKKNSIPPFSNVLFFFFFFKACHPQAFLSSPRCVHCLCSPVSLRTHKYFQHVISRAWCCTALARLPYCYDCVWGVEMHGVLSVCFVSPQPSFTSVSYNVINSS